MSDVLVHVYGVVAPDARLPDGLTGRGGRPVRRIDDDALAVLVSDLDDDARVRREDLLAHAHLLEKAAAEATVIPTRFGVVVPDDDTVRREFLLHRRDELVTLLTAFDGCFQVTVQATFDEEAALREVLDRQPGIKALRQEAADDDTAAQMRLGEAVASTLAAIREDAAQGVVDWLQPHARAVAVQEVRGAYDVASVALLVERADRTRVDAAVSDLDRRLRGRMSLRYVGPQPPYAFLDRVAATEERSWA